MITAVLVAYVLVGLIGSAVAIGVVNRRVVRDIAAAYGRGLTAFGLLGGVLAACVAWPVLWPACWLLDRHRTRAYRR